MAPIAAHPHRTRLQRVACPPVPSPAAAAPIAPTPCEGAAAAAATAATTAAWCGAPDNPPPRLPPRPPAPVAGPDSRGAWSPAWVVPGRGCHGVPCRPLGGVCRGWACGKSCRGMRQVGKTYALHLTSASHVISVQSVIQRSCTHPRVAPAAAADSSGLVRTVARAVHSLCRLCIVIRHSAAGVAGRDQLAASGLGR